jgi:type II secretory pathway component PulC
MKANMMRTPLIKSAVVLLVFVLLAYFTSVSSEGSVLSSVGTIIIGAFRLVQWALAMAIGLTVCIAFLVGIFLFAVYLINKETAATMYAGVKRSVVALCAPVCSCLGSLKCADLQCSQPVQASAGSSEQFKDELQAMIAGEVKKVTDNQQALNDQFVSLNARIQIIEEKSSGFAASGQLEVIAGEIANSAKVLGTVQASVATLEGKLSDTVQQLQAITPEKMLGDIPARLASFEQKGEIKEFDPQPLTESLHILQKEVEELKKKNTGSTRAKKKA